MWLASCNRLLPDMTQPALQGWLAGAYWPDGIDGLSQNQGHVAAGWCCCSGGLSRQVRLGSCSRLLPNLTHSALHGWLTGAYWLQTACLPALLHPWPGFGSTAASTRQPYLDFVDIVDGLIELNRLLCLRGGLLQAPTPKVTCETNCSLFQHSCCCCST
jgi:hypothetical protein